MATARKTTAKGAVCQLMRGGAAEFSVHLRAMMRSDDIEGPHKTRVALRRLRVTLDAFAPIIAGRCHRDLSARLRATFLTVGLLRDADVLAGQLDLPHLHTAATTARAKVRHRLTKAHADRLAPRITRIFAGKSWRRRGHKAKSARNAAASIMAATALTHAWQTCLAFGPDLTTLPDPKRHDLRKALKILRYLSDDFADIWPGAAQDRCLKTLRALQDDLGTLNDRALAQVRGLAVVDDPTTLPNAQTHWAALRMAPVWWT